MDARPENGRGPRQPPTLAAPGATARTATLPAAFERSQGSRSAGRDLQIALARISARRVRWIVRREFSGTAVAIEVLAFDPPAYRRENWWKTEHGVLAFQNEILKYVYYRLTY